MISVELERPYGVCPHCGDDTSWNNDYQYGWTVQSTAHEQFELVWDDPDCNKLRTQLGANCHWRCRTREPSGGSTSAPAITAEQAAALAASVITAAQPLCFPNWQLKTDRKQEIFLAITKALVQQHKEANLHPPATGFVDRAIRLLEKTRYVGTTEPNAAS